MLEYDNTTQAIRQNIDIKDRINISELFENENSQTIFINESEFYSIFFSFSLRS